MPSSVYAKDEPSRFENQLQWRISRCLSDLLVKTSLTTAFGLGVTAAFLPQRRPSSGAIFGLGAGLAMAYFNCEKEFQAALTPPMTSEDLKATRKREEKIFDEPQEDDKKKGKK